MPSNQRSYGRYCTTCAGHTELDQEDTAVAVLNGSPVSALTTCTAATAIGSTSRTQSMPLSGCELGRGKVSNLITRPIQEGILNTGNVSISSEHNSEGNSSARPMSSFFFPDVAQSTMGEVLPRLIRCHHMSPPRVTRRVERASDVNFRTRISQLPTRAKGSSIER